MDSKYLRSLADQLNESAKALRLLADGQDAAQQLFATVPAILADDPRYSLKLDNRCQYALDQLNIFTVAELVLKTADDFLCCRNFGKASLEALRAALKEHGLTLKFDRPIPT